MDAIGRLAGGIAHDFNNMLTVVQMHATLLLSDPREFRAAAPGLQAILDATNRASNLTRQLLTFGRRHSQEARPLDLRETFGLILKLLRRIIGEQVTIETRFALALPAIHADPGMMEQVLVNLVVNARDAMPAGGVLTVTLDAQTLGPDAVAAHPPAKPGRFVCLAVSDTGSGIPPEILPRIFEPFFTTKEAGVGAGLGLATVFGIVQQHGGWIGVTTRAGRGTTFEIFLPAIDRPARRETAAAPEVGVRRGAETILLVEDDEVVRGIAAAALRQQGYRILEAGSAAEALGKWDEVKGDVRLLLTDLVLPGGASGQVLADQLQKRHPDLVVIYTTGYSSEVVSGRLQVKHGRNYLPKPYSFAELATIVRRQLDGD